MRIFTFPEGFLFRIIEWWSARRVTCRLWDWVRTTLTSACFERLLRRLRFDIVRKGQCPEMTISDPKNHINTFESALMVFTVIICLLCRKSKIKSICLLLWNHLLIVKTVLIARFRELVPASRKPPVTLKSKAPMIKKIVSKADLVNWLGIVDYELKGTVPRDFFSWISVLQAPEYPISVILNFFLKIREDIHSSRCTTIIVDTGGKWKRSSIRKLSTFLDPKKSWFSGSTPSNAPHNDVAPLKIITYRAIKTTGTLIVIMKLNLLL